MAVELQAGMRRYTCLIPVVVQEAGKPVEYRFIHLLPVTRRIQREWENGEIQGPHGSLEALIDRLTFEPYYVIEEMQHPDVEMFNREFLTHIPPVISQAIARGELPMPAPVDPYDGYPDGGYPPEDGQAGGQGGSPAPAAPSPAPAPPAAASPAPAASASGLDGLNFELAQAGPDESLGTLDQQKRAADAFAVRATGGEVAGDFAREITGEEAGADGPLARAVRRASTAPVKPAGWTATPRDPFDPRPPAAPVSVNRPPTPLSAALPSAEASEMDTILGAAPPKASAPMPAPTNVPAGTAREAVYQPGPSYVPDMSAVGFEQPVSNAFGIGDEE